MQKLKKYSREIKRLMTDRITAEQIATLFKAEGLEKTSEYVRLAKITLDQDFRRQILMSMNFELLSFHHEHLPEPEFKDACFRLILENITLGMQSGELFTQMTTRLAPVIEEAIQSDLVLEELANVMKDMEVKPRYFMACFYYLILWEGVFKGVRKNLVVLNLIGRGKKVEIDDTLEIAIDKMERSIFKNLLPECFREGNYDRYRNAIAHAHFKFSAKEMMMEFWDIDQITREYTLEPVKLPFEVFFNMLIKVSVFCEIFRLITLVCVAFDDIRLSRYEQRIKK